MANTPLGPDPLEMLKGFWGGLGFPLPGMITPTVDTDELGRRIADLKAVEGWLKSNLSMLQMTIQGLEMQRATLSAFNSMAQAASGSEGEGNPFANPAAWPWTLMPAAASSPASSAKASETDAARETPGSSPKRKPKR
jgi:hypothetical protein